MKNVVRIIGGRWRGRRLHFPNVPGLRPTSDRNRETLFNWLLPDIKEATCLDLFAGSGALGFEALSRGASHVIMVDQSQTIIKYLKKTSQELDEKHTTIYQAQLPQNLPIMRNSVDIVFLDPPFHQDMIKKSSEWLEKSGWLKNNALIYIECEKELFPLPVPTNWHIIRNQKAGQVSFFLMSRK